MKKTNKKLKPRIISTLISNLFLFSVSNVIADESKPWSGLKIGIGVGGSSLENKTSSNAQHTLDGLAEGYPNISDNFVGNASNNQTQHKTNAFASLDAAYDYQVNDKLVFGLIADYKNGKKSIFQNSGSGTASSKSSDKPVVVESEGSSTLTSRLKTGESFALGLRAGWIVEKIYMPYLTAGLTTVKYSQSATYTAHTTGDSGPDYDYSTSASKDGHKLGGFIGAGLETKIYDHASLKFEYRYSDYGSLKLNQSNSSLSEDTGILWPLSGSSVLNVENKLTEQSLRAVISYDF